jgi:hypothetical protein
LPSPEAGDRALSALLLTAERSVPSAAGPPGSAGPPRRC